MPPGGEEVQLGRVPFPPLGSVFVLESELHTVPSGAQRVIRAGQRLSKARGRSRPLHLGAGKLPRWPGSLAATKVVSNLTVILFVGFAAKAKSIPLCWPS